MKKRINKVNSREVIGEDGSIKNSEKLISYSIDAEPDFVKIYFNDLVQVLNLPKNSNKAFYALVQFMNYDNIIIITPGIRKEIAESLGVKVQSLNNNISQLVKGNVIQLIDSGRYRVNPWIVGKGNWKDILLNREKYEINLSINYSEKGKEVILTTKKQPPEKLKVVK